MGEEAGCHGHAGKGHKLSGCRGTFDKSSAENFPSMHQRLDRLRKRKGLSGQDKHIDFFSLAPMITITTVFCSGEAVDCLAWLLRTDRVNGQR